jgi:O-antigen/teichoic acid export membrane protein
MLPDMIIRPGITLVGIFGVFLFFPSQFNVQNIIVLSIVVALITFWVSSRWLKASLPEGFNSIQPQYQLKEWIRSAPPMFIIGGGQILIAQAPIIMLGMLSDAKNVAYLSVALRVATLLIFLPLAVGIVMGPKIASLYSQGKKDHLQNIIKKMNRATFIVTLFLSLVFIVFGKNILTIFGRDFQVAQKALILLTIGYLVDSGFGMSIITLMMTGYEHVVAVYQTFFAFLLIALCFGMIPSQGYESAALAFMVVMVISRFVFVVLAKTKTGINTTIF